MSHRLPVSGLDVASSGFVAAAGYFGRTTLSGGVCRNMTLLTMGAGRRHTSVFILVVTFTAAESINSIEERRSLEISRSMLQPWQPKDELFLSKLCSPPWSDAWRGEAPSFSNPISGAPWRLHRANKDDAIIRRVQRAGHPPSWHLKALR